MSPCPRPNLVTALAAAFATLPFVTTSLSAQAEQGFLPNLGQYKDAVRFQTHAPVGAAWFTDAAFVADLRAKEESGVVLRLEFLGRDAAAERPVGVTRLPGEHHFLRGGRTVTDVPSYRSLRYAGIYEGTDVVVRAHPRAAGLFEYDLHLQPGAQLDRIRIHCEGMERLSIDANGSLVMHTEIGAVVQAQPITWETLASGKRAPRLCRFRLLDAATFGFTVEGWTGRNPLTIDPGLVLSTYLGGNGIGNVQKVRRTDKGYFIIGATTSTNFPTNTGAYQRGIFSYSDATVAALKPDGKFLFGTYVGGLGSDYFNALVMLPNGDLIIGGTTKSSDWPTTKGAFQTKMRGASDGVLCKLSGDGKKLLYSTFYGGDTHDIIKALHLDGQGILTIGGSGSPGLPTTKGAFQSTNPTTTGYGSPFVARMKPDLKTQIYSTYVGGTEFGLVHAVDVQDNAEVTLGGQTGSWNFPTTKGAFQTIQAGNARAASTAFVARLNAQGSNLQWATYLSGAIMERVEDLHVHRNGAVTASGWTLSPKYPVTAQAFQPVYAGPTKGFYFRGDGFISRLSNDGRRLEASTFLGGDDEDDVINLDVDGADNVTVIGSTGSKGFPVTRGAFRTTYISPGFPTWVGDAFVARFDPSLSTLIYSSFFGGKYTETGVDVLFDAKRLVATMVGTSGSKNMPVTKGAYQSKLGGRLNAFITRMELLPKGARNLYAASPCRGDATLEPIGSAHSNDTKFRMIMTGAAPNTNGLLLVSPFVLPKPINLGAPWGGLLIVPPTGALLVPITANALGTTTLKLNLTGVKAGATGYLQTVWANPPGVCQTKDLISTSNGLQLTVQ